MKPDAVSRREFLAAGSGLFVFAGADALDAQQAGGARPSYPADFNAYLRIGPDGRVACFTGKVEMGQGEMTATAQYVADELDVGYDSVDVTMGDTGLCPWDSGTGGSTGIQLFSPVMRRMAAEARAVLLQMAAERLQAPVERLRVHGGTVVDPSTGNQVTYAEMVQGKRIERHLANVPIKTPEEFRLIGRPQPSRKGALDIVTGKTKFTGDISLPGMLCARILRPPAIGATLQDVDAGAAPKKPAPWWCEPAIWSRCFTRNGTWPTPRSGW